MKFLKNTKIFLINERSNTICFNRGIITRNKTRHQKYNPQLILTQSRSGEERVAMLSAIKKNSFYYELRLWNQFQKILYPN